jgi:hypothetical protein
MGADVSLVDGGVANALLISGARDEKLRFPVKFKGVGKGELVATRRLVTTLQFPLDDKVRELKAYIVRECPHGIIIGTDFMEAESIGYVQTGGLIQLHEWHEGEPRLVYSERPARKKGVIGGNVNSVETETCEKSGENEFDIPVRQNARSKKARR